MSFRWTPESRTRIHRFVAIDLLFLVYAHDIFSLVHKAVRLFGFSANSVRICFQASWHLEGCWLFLWSVTATCFVGTVDASTGENTAYGLLQTFANLPLDAAEAFTEVLVNSNLRISGKFRSSQIIYSDFWENSENILWIFIENVHCCKWFVNHLFVFCRGWFFPSSVGDISLSE